VWSGLRDERQLYLGQFFASLLRPNGELTHFEFDRVETGLQSIAAALSERRGRLLQPRVKVWLSGALARPFRCGPVEGLRGWAEASSMCEAMAPAATGFDGDCLVYLNGWPGEKSAQAVAMERSLLADLEALALHCRFRLRSVKPAWTYALRQHGKEVQQGGLLAIVERDAMTLLSQADPAPDVPGTYLRLANETELRQQLKRLALSAGVSARSCSVATVEAINIGGQLLQVSMSSLEAAG